ELRAMCDLSTLHLESGTFVEDDLRQYASDILWSMKTTTGDDGYIHLLIEHQSGYDKNIAFRQMRYAVAAMQRHLDAGHDKLPLVIPLQFYHGERSPYPHSTNWLHCFSNPEMACKIYTNPFPLVDVTVLDDDEIVNHRRMAALTLLMKHVRQRDMMELLDRLSLVMVKVSDEQVRVLIHYMVNAGDSVSPEFMRALAERLPQHEDKLMTIAERLEQKGIEKGIVIGENRGMEKWLSEGERKATLKIARTMLQNGLDHNTIMKMTGLTAEELAQIRH
ncbi:Rpn family recombination-promoting nuclease/putative transposase, partial [Salmonella enterica subsp. diarizonae]|nr:Rpn family recombination-promoting nuclease/putative transposase [Salmonella enterica subsp. diarizonae]